MSQLEKLLAKLTMKPTPTDFMWKEVEKLMGCLGYKLICGNGARRKFLNEKTGRLLRLHEPHQGNELKQYAVNIVISHLISIGVLEDEE